MSPSEGADEKVVGIIGDPVSIPCPGASPGQDILWADLVYNMQAAPQAIFSSVNNPEMRIDPGHPMKHNYKVDSDYTLTILKISENDGGVYICSTEGGAEPKTTTYQLSLLGKNDPDFYS